MPKGIDFVIHCFARVGDNVPDPPPIVDVKWVAVDPPDRELNRQGGDPDYEVLRTGPINESFKAKCVAKTRGHGEPTVESLITLEVVGN